MNCKEILINEYTTLFFGIFPPGNKKKHVKTSKIANCAFVLKKYVIWKWPKLLFLL